MNRSIFFVSTVVLLALTMTVATFAQERERRGRGGRPRGFGRRMDKALLLRSDKVREEVKITEEQAKKVDEILESHQGSLREFSFRGLRDLSDEERAAKLKELNAKRAELSKKTVAALEVILQKDQTTRLNEIELQQQGIQGFVSDRCVAALKLSDEQVEKIKATIKSRQEAMRKLTPRGRRRPDSDEGGSAEDTRAKIEKLRKDTDETALAILSAEQREGLTKLKGEPFKLDRRSFRRGGRGGRGRPGGDGEGGRGRRKRERPPADDTEV